ncbi:cyclic pyranopterin phosphate synthase [Microbacteriaceae bacterium SG_E_30_P1]|uniref:GTP 3',8-cyclase n=1 Tax=Antiquaquibacter oligotrophicus TaxID=2880260 RepID=A0ABT6KP49_9MICO|nr:GTP 3',8-cyclase MoaA [Antiquaquibacter oligotrophicus]MDH6181540.1 cyclic pyranopterin phosphate synthase [Antiquaquibacter oligotrophicus]UDF12771.1 GTP 3',8-cyclase MoaA [Antiquaquibacter oligotrophicus]
MARLGLGLPAIRRAPGIRPDTTGRPDDAGLIDRFGRRAHDLRISLTEKCSLRCTYCMPAEGLPAIAREDLLTPTEIARLVRIAVRDLGVRDIRFTGGEPLLRADLEQIIRLSREFADGASMSLTTNGIGLDKRIDGLLAAGLDRLNISLDTVDRDHFARLTRRDRLPAVLAGIEAAKRAGIAPLKINAVLMRDTLHGAVDLLEWALENGARLRFIEQMPLDADEAWARDNMVDAAELLDVLGTRFTLTQPHRDDPSAPAEEWFVDGGPATVGIIASVTRSFCAACDRTRITAEGTVRSCLFGDDETDLRALLRGGADDDELADRWRAAQWGKQAGHGMERADFVRPVRSMGAIGG